VIGVDVSINFDTAISKIASLIEVYSAIRIMAEAARVVEVL
jgi:hypothetical protein